MGIKGISIWREAVQELEYKQVKEVLKSNCLIPVSYVRGGFFPYLEKEKRETAINDNIKMLQEASEMEIPMLVLVCGAEPLQSLEISREQIIVGVESILPIAEELGVIEGFADLLGAVDHHVVEFVDNRFGSTGRPRGRTIW